MSSELDGSPKENTEKMMLEAILDGEGSSWQHYSTSLPAERALRVMAIATSAAIFRKWPDDPSLEAVVAYVEEVDKRYPEELPIGRSVIESVIRGAFGESDLLTGTPGEQIVVAEALLIRSIGFDVLSSPVQRTAYLDEVLTAVG
jgi:hypothetical protein